MNYGKSVKNTLCNYLVQNSYSRVSNFHLSLVFDSFLHFRRLVPIFKEITGRANGARDNRESHNTRSVNVLVVYLGRATTAVVTDVRDRNTRAG